MGACGSNQYIQKNQMSNRNHNDTELWSQIKRASFEAPDFKYVKEIQDIYTNTYGGYLMPIQMAGLLLEFKRFLFLIAQQCKEEMNVKAAPQDISGRIKLVTPTRLNPSPIVDRLWRMLITNTRLYEEFCIRNFGGLLDRDSTKLGTIDGYNTTLTKLRESFTYFDREIWPPYTRNAELQDAFDGFLWIVLQDFLDFHLAFKKLSTQGAFTQAKQEEELNRLRNKHLRRHPDEIRPSDNRFSMGAPQNATEHYTAAGARRQAEPQVAAAPRGDDDDEGGDNDFFANFKAGVDFEDPPPKRIHVEGKIVANTDVPIAKPSHKKIPTTLLEDDDQIEPEFMSDEEDDEDIKEEEEEEIHHPVNKREEQVAKKEEPVEDDYQTEEPEKFVIEEEDRKQDMREERVEEKYQRRPPTPEKETSAKPPAILTPVVPPESNIRAELIEGLSADWMDIKKKHEGVLKFKIPGIVERTFQREINTTVLLCDDIFNEYKKFHLLKQVVRADVKLVPSHYVKLAWEYHLIETAQYRRFCFDCFGHFVHSSQHLPRKVDDVQKYNYQNTLRLYEHVFGQKAPRYVWPDVEERFNYNKLYNNKFINLNGYIADMMAGKKNHRSPIENERSFRERAQALGNMNASYLPERGSQFIIIKQEGDLQARGPMPITSPQKRDPGAEYYRGKQSQSQSHDKRDFREADDNRYIKDDMKVPSQPPAGAFDDEMQIRADAKIAAQTRIDKEEAGADAKAGVGVRANIL